MSAIKMSNLDRPHLQSYNIPIYHLQDILGDLALSAPLIALMILFGVVSRNRRFIIDFKFNTL